jgi:hypothetical protein
MEKPMKVTPLEKQQVSGPAVAIYDELEQNGGKVINVFKVLAYKPGILKSFVEFYQQVWREGKRRRPRSLRIRGRRFSMVANTERASIPLRRSGVASPAIRSRR